MKKFLIALAATALIGCTSEGVQTVSGDVFEYQGVYLKRITIDGTSVFLRCDQNGVPLKGRAEDVSIDYSVGKSRHSTTYIGGE